jgi:NADH-quinone oxidoreductase subunit F
MRFEEIQHKAKLQWDDFNGLKRPRILIGAVTCGCAAGALSVRSAFEKQLNNSKIKADLYEVGCLGMCYAEPLVEIGMADGRRVMYGNVTEEMVPELVKDFIKKGDPRPDLALATFGDTLIDGIPRFSELPMIKGQVRIALRNAGIIDPTNVDHYIARDGYTGLIKALSMSPEEQKFRAARPWRRRISHRNKMGICPQISRSGKICNMQCRRGRSRCIYGPLRP